jgi:hypothetical protein
MGKQQLWRVGGGGLRPSCEEAFRGVGEAIDVYLEGVSGRVAAWGECAVQSS